MPYLIVILPRAMADIRSTVTWLSKRSPVAAARRHAGILASIRTLATNPKRCPLADEAADLGLELRELLYGRKRSVYRIFFTIDGRTVIIHRVRHAAQDNLTADDV